MEPTRDTHATLVDLLDRVLDKGLVIHADIIISVAGIPLIGVNLRAALAGMETMIKYGIMQAWDERTRIWEREHRRKKEVISQQCIRRTESGEEIETCPQCGKMTLVKELLEEGCKDCKWISPRQRRQLAEVPKPL